VGRKSATEVPSKRVKIFARVEDFIRLIV